MSLGQLYQLVITKMGSVDTSLSLYELMKLKTNASHI